VNWVCHNDWYDDVNELNEVVLYIWWIYNMTMWYYDYDDITMLIWWWWYNDIENYDDDMATVNIWYDDVVDVICRVIMRCSCIHG
jgi:hypothetical protein